MNEKSIYTVIGLMSGTSVDGVDVACLRTDGQAQVERLENASFSYPDALRDQLKACLGKKADADGAISATEKAMTEFHAECVAAFIDQNSHDYDLIGFHGHTIFHDPDNQFTWQIGDGQLLAEMTGYPVVYDMRKADVLSGGQGAPLLPLYHAALAAELDKPLAILNIGGVANITYIGQDEGDVIAFDTGPGNALLDDWISKHTGERYDRDGRVARSGQVNAEALKEFQEHDYFSKVIPKSLDRDQWSIESVSDLGLEDGAATLVSFTVEGVAQAFQSLPHKPGTLYVTGGGRHNGYMMERMANDLNVSVENVDTLGWSGDAMEAEGFAYLAVRSLKSLPLSLPATTGVKAPKTGGVIARPHVDRKIRHSN